MYWYYVDEDIKQEFGVGGERVEVVISTYGLHGMYEVYSLCTYLVDITCIFSRR